MGVRLVALATLGAVATLATEAPAASRRCRVGGDVGGMVTVSGTPGGAAFTELAAGAEVTTGETARDGTGRSWLFIHDAATGRRLGWLPAGALRCP